MISLWGWSSETQVIRHQKTESTVYTLDITSNTTVSHRNNLSASKVKRQWMNEKSTSQQEEEEGHDRRVSKVEECADKARDLELRHVIVNAVHEVVDGGESTRQKGSPPPVVVLPHTHYITAAIYIIIFITSLQLFIVRHHTHYITYSPTSHALHHCSYC